MSCGIHLGDIGTSFRISILDCNSNAIDISNASTKQIIFKKPGGGSLTKTASFVTDGTDGLLEYNTISGDLDEVGTWKIQAYVVAPNGSWRTNFSSFKVHRNL